MNEWKNTCQVRRFSINCECGSQLGHLEYGEKYLSPLYCSGCGEIVQAIPCHTYLIHCNYQTKDKLMETQITATFAVSQPITLVASTPDEIDEIVEMFFSNGAITVTSKIDGIV